MGQIRTDLGSVPSGRPPRMLRLNMTLLHRIGLGPLLGALLKDEEGHDVVEYTLLLAFLTLASAAMYIGVGGSLVTIWSASNVFLNNVSTEIPRS